MLADTSTQVYVMHDLCTNNDSGDRFGAGLTARFGDAKMSVTYDDLTEPYLGTTGCRTDEITPQAGWNWLSAGVRFSGDYGGRQLQNQEHRIGDLFHRDHNPYERDHAALVAEFTPHATVTHIRYAADVLALSCRQLQYTFSARIPHGHWSIGAEYKGAHGHALSAASAQWLAQSDGWYATVSYRALSLHVGRFTYAEISYTFK